MILKELIDIIVDNKLSHNKINIVKMFYPFYPERIYSIYWIALDNYSKEIINGIAQTSGRLYITSLDNISKTKNFECIDSSVIKFIFEGVE